MENLATVQRISDIQPIEGADFLDIATVQGWEVLVKKGQHQVGDLVVYIEPDTLLPNTDPLYDFLRARGQKTMQVDGEDVTGHVLKVMRMRGHYSQGIVFSLMESGLTSENYVVEVGYVEEGDDVTEEMGVYHYEKPVPVGGKQKGDFDLKFTPKSDAIRVEKLNKYWDKIVEMNWDVTLKVDGTSVTLVNDDGLIRAFSRNWEMVVDDYAPYNLANELGVLSVLADYPGMAIQFEYAGPGVQSNPSKLATNQMFIFAVAEKGERTPRFYWPEQLLPLAVPVLSDEWQPRGTMAEMIEKVEGLRSGLIGKDTLDEGLVFHPRHGLHPWLGRTNNFKIINKKFALKNGE